MDIKNVIKSYNNYKAFSEFAEKADKQEIIGLLNHILNKVTEDSDISKDDFEHRLSDIEVVYDTKRTSDDIIIVRDLLGFYYKGGGDWECVFNNGDLLLRYVDKKNLIIMLGSLLERKDILLQLNKGIFKKMNEGVESKPDEFRLNTLKNFNHFNKDQMGGMEIFAPRVNTEINRISDDIFDEDDQEEEYKDENGNFVNDLENSYSDDDSGLVINDEENGIETPERSYDYPYGMDNNPRPTFKMDGNTQSKSNIIFRFADYRRINNFR